MDIKGKSTAIINFMTKPNYFRISNTGKTNIYLSLSGVPTPNRYDLKVPPATNRLYAEPYGRNQIMLYNDGTDNATAILTSYTAEFDPLVLALDGGVDLGGVIQDTAYDGVIKGFTASLPTGANKIGKVEVDKLPAIPAGVNKIGKVDVDKLPALPAGTNNIGKVEIDNLPSLPTGTNNIGKVEVTALPSGTNIGKVDVETLPPLPAGTNNIGKVAVETLPPLPAGTNTLGTVNITSQKLNSLSNYWARYNEVRILCNESIATTTEAPGLSYNSTYLTNIILLSNDSSTDDLTIRFEGTSDLYQARIKLKPKEQLTNVKCALFAIHVSGNNVPYRIIGAGASINQNVFEI